MYIESKNTVHIYAKRSKMQNLQFGRFKPPLFRYNLVLLSEPIRRFIFNVMLHYVYHDLNLTSFMAIFGKNKCVFDEPQPN